MRELGEKIKKKNKCGEWGLNPQPLEQMRELGENKCGDWGLNPQPLGQVRKLRDKLKEK